MERTKASAVNAITSSLSRVIELVFQIVSRRFVIQILGVEYLGINGFFANILFIFSIAEMGFSYALVQTMYKPMAEADNERLHAICRYFRSLYLKVIVVMVVAGVITMPLLPLLIADNQSIDDLYVIYLFFFSSFIIPYFVAYRRSLIVVAQKEYVVSIYSSIIRILQIVLQIALLFFFHNYLLFISVQLLSTCAISFIIYVKSSALFPFLKNKYSPTLDKQTKQTIVGNAKALFINNMSGILLTGTDNVIISSLLGLSWVGIYTNYTSITNALNGFINSSLQSITASIGDYANQREESNLELLLRRVYFIEHAVVITACSCCFGLFNDFISLAYGSEFIASNSVLAFIVLNFFLTLFRIPTLMVRNVLGIFRHDRYKGVAECIINLVLSIILVNKIGLVGVLIGTATSTILVTIWIEPYILYRDGFHRPVAGYWEYQWKFILFFIILCAISFFTFGQYVSRNWLFFLGKSLLLVLFSIAACVLSFCRTPEFKYVFSVFSRIQRAK